MWKRGSKYCIYSHFIFDVIAGQSVFPSHTQTHAAYHHITTDAGWRWIIHFFSSFVLFFANGAVHDAIKVSAVASEAENPGHWVNEVDQTNKIVRTGEIESNCNPCCEYFKFLLFVDYLFYRIWKYVERDGLLFTKKIIERSIRRAIRWFILKDLPAITRLKKYAGRMWMWRDGHGVRDNEAFTHNKRNTNSIGPKGESVLFAK